MIEEINTAKVDALTEQSGQLLSLARQYVITSPEMYAGAADELKRIKGKTKELEELRFSMTRPLDDAKKRIIDLFREPATRLSDAETVIKRAMLGFQQEQERQRQEQERIARAAAEKERARLAAQAAKAEAAGKLDKADELEQRAASVPTPIVAAPLMKVAGIAMREEWEFEIVDASLLPREYLVPDMARIRGVVKSLKGDTNIPGVRAYGRSNIAAGRR